MKFNIINQDHTFPALTKQDVHVFCVRFDDQAGRQKEYLSWLAKDERAHAERFLRPRDAMRYILGRGWLRQILGHYLNMKPASIPFAYGTKGKPFLLERGIPSSLRFNVSHSSELILGALTRHRDLGVDVEMKRSNVDCETLALQFFSQREQEIFFSLPISSRQKAFFLAWTRKEAYLKGLGTGLATSLESFDVSLAPHSHPRLLAVRGKPNEPTRWEFHAWTPQSGYEACVAVKRVSSQRVWATPTPTTAKNMSEQLQTTF